jgi:hypothetical protein
MFGDVCRDEDQESPQTLLELKRFWGSLKLEVQMS